MSISRFAEPTPLPDGRTLVTLRDAAHYITEGGARCAEGKPSRSVLHLEADNRHAFGRRCIQSPVSSCPAAIGAAEATGTKSKLETFTDYFWAVEINMSSRAAIEVAHTAVDLTPSPIEPSWIIKGNPVAESALLAKSSDGLAWTMVWQCSEGSFHWYYDLDETILILEGSLVLENDTMSPTRYGPGDVILFKDGAHAKWHVEGHVRKLAFLRRTSPVLLGFALRGFSKIKRTVVAARKRR